MSTKKYLIDTLAATEKPEFDKIVKTYLSEIYGFKRIVFTDGPYDTGIDIKIFDIDGIKNQYQLTIQKSDTPHEKREFEKKLYSDLEKAKKNSDDFGYEKVLFFFYSSSLTNKTIREYESKALVNYGISLTLIESNRISDEAEEYLQLLNSIVETNNLKEILDTNKVFPSEEKNLLFDLLSFGKASDLRFQIVEAYILKQFHVKGKLTADEIIANCQEKFKAQENVVFYEKLIARLQTEKRIFKDEDKINFILSESESKRISGLIGQSEIEEQDLLKHLIDILKKYDQEQFVEDYLIELKKIYINNFNADISEIVSTSTKDLSALSREFLTFIQSKGITAEDTNDLAESLFKICKENQYIQKFSAAKVFSETTNISNIERYIHTQKRVFVDTQVILYALCYFYNPKSTYSNYFFNTTKALLNFTRRNKISLFLPSNYLWEAQSHLREALNLIPFTNLKNFEKLGKSRNAFYNFFLFEREILNDNDFTYIDFFEKFGFKINDKYTLHNNLIELFISKLGIEVTDVDTIYYDIEDAKRIIIDVLHENEKVKSKFGLNNDAIIMEYLADGDVDVHPLQPMLLSWDKVLFKAQKEYFKKFPTSSRWFLLTPGRFIDQYSLLQFSIDSDIVTDEILAFLSSDLIKNTHSLLDSITHILNPTDEVGLEYTNILAQIRDNEIHRIKENKITLPDDVEGEAVIDDVMYNLTFHYKDSKDDFEMFKVLFTNKELITDVTSLIEKSIEEFYRLKKFNSEIFLEFDQMISKAKK